MERDSQQNSNSSSRTVYRATLRQALMAGAVAGTAVDFVLFPLDTIKTRLQSQAGFLMSGGFQKMYSGMLSSFVGSAPNAALFFVTYEAIKRLLYTTSSDNHHQQHQQHHQYQQLQSPYIYMTAATCGEISACTIRVPTEVIKQRMQINQFTSTYSALSSVLRTEGILGLYRGFLPTVAREIPFTCIQFPLYEYFKSRYSQYHGNRIVEPFEAAVMGSVAGGIAAAITTPLDVCKTRIILSTKAADTGARPYTSIAQTMKRIIAEEGPKKLFAGLGPRVLWISVGGTIFFGVYEKGLKTFNELQLLER